MIIQWRNDISKKGQDLFIFLINNKVVFGLSEGYWPEAFVQSRGYATAKNKENRANVKISSLVVNILIACDLQLYIFRNVFILKDIFYCYDDDNDLNDGGGGC